MGKMGMGKGADNTQFDGPPPAVKQERCEMCFARFERQGLIQRGIPVGYCGMSGACMPGGAAPNLVRGCNGRGPAPGVPGPNYGMLADRSNPKPDCSSFNPPEPEPEVEEPEVAVDPVVEEEAAAVGDPHLSRANGETIDMMPEDLSFSRGADVEAALHEGLEAAKHAMKASGMDEELDMGMDEEWDGKVPRQAMGMGMGMGM